MNRAFDRLSAWLSAQIGRPMAFLLVCLLSLAWLAAALGTGRADAIIAAEAVTAEEIAAEAAALLAMNKEAVP